MSRSLIRPPFCECESYSPGLNSEAIRESLGLSSVIKLASNENPLGVPPGVLEVLRDHAAEAHRYPRPGSPRLCQALGAHHGIPADRFVAGNGSDEIIDLLIRVAVEPGREHVLAFRPCFGIYKLQSRLCGVEFRQIDLRPDFSFPSQANFILVKPPTPAADLFEKLLQRGIIVRPLASYGLRDHLRISIGNSAEQEILLTLLQEILRG